MKVCKLAFKNIMNFIVFLSEIWRGSCEKQIKERHISTVVLGNGVCYDTEFLGD